MALELNIFKAVREYRLAAASHRRLGDISEASASESARAVIRTHRISNEQPFAAFHPALREIIDNPCIMAPQE